MEMLISLLKLQKPLLIFLVEPMMSYTDAFDILFEYVNMHLVATIEQDALMSPNPRRKLEDLVAG